MSTGDMRNVSIGMGESVEAIFPSASVPGGRNVAGGVILILLGTKILLEHLGVL